MNPSWKVRKYRDGDESGILELMKAIYGRWHSPQYWEWKYKKNPAGSSIICLAAEEDGKVVGHYGSIPFSMKLGNSYVKASFNTDGATHPMYRGQGVFSVLVNKCHLEVAANAIPLTYGIADANLGPTYKRYEWAGHICFMVNMIKVIDRKAVLRSYLGNRHLGWAPRVLKKMRSATASDSSSVTVEQVNRFDSRIDEFWTTISPWHTVIVRRDQRHLNWRYADHPEQKYKIYTAMEHDQILGYCVLGTGQWRDLEFGYIVDIMGVRDDRDTVGCLVKTAVEYFEGCGVDVIACMMSEGHPYQRMFRRAGFLTSPLSRRQRALYATINLQGTAIDERKAYSQALALSQNHFLRNKTNWFMMSADAP